MSTKLCSRCGIEKKLEEFPIHKRGKNGRDSVCKACKAERERKRRMLFGKEIYEREKEYRRKYRQLNKDRISEYHRKYHRKNRSKINEYKRIWAKSFAKFDSYAAKLINIEETRRDKETGEFLEIRCAYCGKWFKPTNYQVKNRLQAFNGTQKSFTERRIYCSKLCKTECPVYNRKKFPKGFKPASSREVQPELRRLVFERDQYRCQRCGMLAEEAGVGLHCHHILPVKLEPIESADIDNCITLCKNCHILIHSHAGCRSHEIKNCGE
ncbi:MAG: HNH endonuclease [Candidatus Heimdallarchaeaceae archaeon]